NGGALIKREYALGRLRVDILITYKEKHYPLEVKIKYAKSEEENLKQLWGYLDRSSSQEGWLLVCDKDLNKPWENKLTWETKQYQGKAIHLVGC
ncbi:MAG: hypothetical protein LBO05_04725, partial [Deltaproteobacteria bacterium]|nr:hypothetical protein [Deltaproteobacteria bacterium]